MPSSSDLAAHADSLRETLSAATLSNCLEVARTLLELAKSKKLPVPPTYQVEPLNLQMAPYPRGDRQRQRLVLPLRSEVKQQLGFEPDEVFPLWYYHVTTEFITAILVDYLTGEQGASFDGYLNAFFDYPQYLQLAEYDVQQKGEPV